MKKTTILAVCTLMLPLTLQAQQPPRSMTDAFMEHLDKNKDGKVDRIEFLTPYENQFKMMDKNGDGGVDRAEIEAIEKMARQRMEAMRQQKGGK